MKKKDARFEVYKDSKNEYRWRLISSNENIIADSAEGYKNKTDCINGLKATNPNAPFNIVDSLGENIEKRGRKKKNE